MKSTVCDIGHHQNKIWPQTINIKLTQILFESFKFHWLAHRIYIGPVPCNKPGFPTLNLFNNKNQQKGEEKMPPERHDLDKFRWSSWPSVEHVSPWTLYPLKVVGWFRWFISFKNKKFPRFRESFPFSVYNAIKVTYMCSKWCPIQTHQTNQLPPNKMVLFSDLVFGWIIETRNLAMRRSMRIFWRKGPLGWPF